MQKKELKQMEELLIAKKNALLQEVEERFNKYRDANNDKVMDIAEMASCVSDGEMEILLAEEDIRELKQIEDALGKIRSGNYGICEHCGCSIKKERLKAIPFATLCVNCKEEEERFQGPKSVQINYDWERVIADTEKTEVDDIDGRSLGRKFTEIEYDELDIKN